VASTYAQLKNEAAASNPSAQKDCIQWVMESSPRSKPWTAERIVYELIALWFGSVHITSTVSQTPPLNSNSASPACYLIQQRP